MKRKLVLFTIDLGLTTLSAIAALFFRFGFDIATMSRFVFPTCVGIPIYTISYIINGIYRIVWAYADERDMFILLRAVALGYLSHVVLFYFWSAFVLPRSVGAMMAMGSFVMIVGSRLFWIWFVRHRRFSSARGKRILIVGAGEGGVILLEDFMNRPELGKVVGFVDDSPRKIGRTIRGVPVYGPISAIMEFVDSLEIDEVIIAIPSASSEEMKRILSYIDRRKVRVKTLPKLYELMSKRSAASLLREVSIQDLLGREEIKIDIPSIAEYIKEKKIMVTGAGGSIGSEICRQIARFSPNELILLGRGENSIYQIHEELQEMYPELRVHSVIGDITNPARLNEIFEEYKPEIVFHAAAHKHVHLMEKNPSEAFWVNAHGTKMVADMCCRFGVKRMILISTDKAVKPVSFMGVSKRLAEMYVKALAQTECVTRFSIVRFGNVLGSRGSVIPKFQRQIERGGPVTVTDHRMKRFFMSISEAVALVIQAGAFEDSGSLYVLDMGELISIDKLAREMIVLAGYEPDKDIKIVYTGIRPGEKLVEELYADDERLLPTAHPKIYRVDSQERWSVEELTSLIYACINMSRRRKYTEMVNLLKKFIPDMRVKS